MPAKPPAPGGPPRPVFPKLLQFRDLLLQKARSNGPFEIANLKVSMFPDFTATVQAKRNSFLEVKREMCSEGIQYSLRFPAKLRIMLDGSTHIFFTLAEAWDWLETYKREGSQAPNGGFKPHCYRKNTRRSPSFASKPKKPNRTQTEGDKLDAILTTASITNLELLDSDNGTTTGAQSEDDASDLTSCSLSATFSSTQHPSAEGV